MRPGSLSLRLGLSVGALCVALLALLALLAHAALGIELDTRARKGLEEKLQQVRHVLVTDMGSSTESLRAHILRDLVTSHGDLRLNVLQAQAGAAPLLDIESAGLSATLDDMPVDEDVRFREWTDTAGTPLLTLATLVEQASGERLRVYLTLDRSDDHALRESFLDSTLISLPFLLLLIGLGTWWIVQHGLLPLNRFRKVASRVSTDDLSHRIPVEKLPRELGEAASAINFMLSRLDSGVQQLAQFSDDLAHELRAPISNLMGKAQVTLSRERPAEEYKEVLIASVEELERMARMVTDMLFLAQVSHPQALIPFERLAIDREVWRVAELFVTAAEEKRVGIDIQGRGRVLGDQLMVQRAISNLLSNAIRHASPDSDISIRIENVDGNIVLSVENLGPGIPKQHLPHLFERFYRVDRSRSRTEGGSGLGLAIVQSIMSLHLGKVEVDSQPGARTVFRLVFPGPEEAAANRERGGVSATARACS
ncbi:heavy metal sensor histidine kinase [Zestomonas carbonaria]|uniref:Sensor protein n=1 Tax=Zestomonas carbonaria TaxID=2762745 RepID=A0A7U7IAI1_9GAMM|nr:heavy metal sensor histidine kinase [Pseudomonas carbonaria]CAD5109479.1 Sensor protein CzcS [Pseudomonas carbonaria]